MKKIIIAALAVFMATGASARGLDYEPEEGLTWQAQIGMNVSDLNGAKFDGLGLKPAVGAKIGAYGQYMFPNAHGTFINFGLNYDMKGARRSDTVMGITSTTKVITHYLSVPVHVGFQYNFIPELGVYADFGPYFGVGVGGRYALNVTDMLDYHEPVFTGDQNNALNLNVFDWGLGFRVGAEYNQHYSLNFGFDWGLMDVLRNKWHVANPGMPSWKNFNCAITLGYRF